MSETTHVRRKRSIHSAEDSESTPHNPLCLWRYLIAYSIFATVWLVIVYAKVVVDKERPRMGTTLLYLSLAFACLAYTLEETYVWWKEQRGTAGPDDYTDAGTKKWMLAAVVIGGGCLIVGITRAMVLSAGLNAEQRIPQPDAPPPAGGGGGPGAVPARPSFDPTAPRPLAAIPPAASGTPGLLAYWPFDENGGAQAADAGPDGLHAVLGGRWVPGVRGSALWITGPTDAVQLGAGAVLNFPRNAPFTFTGWIRTMDDGIVFALRDSKDPGAVIMLSVEKGQLCYLVREDRGEIGVPARVSGPRIIDGNWHHFAATRNSGNEIELFVDGESAGRHQAGQSGGPITTDLRFVGREEYCIRVGYPMKTTWNGVIDELAIFGRQLAPDEIASLAGRR